MSHAYFHLFLLSRFVAVTDAVLGYKAKLHIFPFSKNKDELTDQPIVSVEMTERFKILDALWSPLNKHIIAGTDDGRVLVFDAETLKLVHEIRDNQRDKEIKRLHQSKDRYSFMTASTDHTARLYDAETFENIKVYETGRPCNAAAFNEHTNHVFLAGGQVCVSSLTCKTFFFFFFFYLFSIIFSFFLLH